VHCTWLMAEPLQAHGYHSLEQATDRETYHEFFGELFDYGQVQPSKKSSLLKEILGCACPCLFVASSIVFVNNPAFGCRCLLGPREH
jgi:hypothetical protein